MKMLTLLTMVWVGTMFILGCVPKKAAIDYSYSGDIVWPGGKLAPRIKYLWSLSRISDLAEYSDVTALMENPRESVFLVRPHGVFVSPHDVMFITDTSAARVNVVDLNTMEAFDILGFDGINFSSPIGVVEAPDGAVYISDADLRAVGKFDRKGKFIGYLEGKFERPTGIALDARMNRLYISDTWAHKIFIYGLDGFRLGSFGEHGEKPGQLNYPTHLAVGPDNNIYVSDTVNFRVQIFSPSGEFVGGFGLPGDRYGSFDKIKGIALDSEGHIYVADSRLDMIQIYDRQGRLLLFFGEEGQFYGQFRLPEGIYIDEHDRIFVADGLNRRVQAFQFLGGD